jgi:acetylornithine/succinyldiaminopimelate/putrescine aminotransferase
LNQFKEQQGKSIKPISKANEILTRCRVIPPPPGYLQDVAALCKKHNVLFIVDEVQAGLGRSGANLCHLRDKIRPDMVVLGKALAGGMYALSGVLGDDRVMGIIDPYEYVPLDSTRINAEVP